MTATKKTTIVGLISCYLFTACFSTSYAIGVEPPPAKYSEQEYRAVVDTLESQNIHRRHNRKTTAYLACFLGWIGGENFYLHQYYRFGIFLVGVVVFCIPAGIYSIINGRAYFAMTDQQFDQLHNPAFFGQVEQIIRSKKEEGQQTVNKLNKGLADCRTLYEAGGYDKALNACKSVKSEIEAGADKPLKSSLYGLMGNIYEKLGDYLSARHEYAKALSNAQNPASKASLAQDANIAEDMFVKTFLKVDYDKRKLVMLVDNIQKGELPEHVNILDVKKLPNIEFRNGSPATNQLYVGHPYISNQYIQLENSQYELLRDRIGEYFELMQALGATKVDVKSITINKQEYGLETNAEAGGHMSANPSKVIGKLGVLSAIVTKVLPKDKVSVSATQKEQGSKSVTESAFHGLKIKQVFYPKKKPYLPKGLIWYPHESSWQRLYRQRLQGDLLQHTEKISTNSNKLIQGSELSQIAGDLAMLFGGIDANRDNTIKKTIGTQEDVELTIDVKFAPLDSLK